MPFLYQIHMLCEPRNVDAAHNIIVFMKSQCKVHITFWCSNVQIYALKMVSHITRWKHMRHYLIERQHSRSEILIYPRYNFLLQQNNSGFLGTRWSLTKAKHNSWYNKYHLSNHTDEKHNLVLHTIRFNCLISLVEET